MPDKWEAVETKFCIEEDEVGKTVKVRIKPADESPLKGVLAIQSDDFTCYAKYAGDNKPGKLPSAAGKVTEITGYNDFGGGANLREQGEGSIIVIDTEYRSFSTENVAHISHEIDAELGGAEFSFLLTDLLG